MIGAQGMIRWYGCAQRPVYQVGHGHLVDPAQPLKIGMPITRLINSSSMVIKPSHGVVDYFFGKAFGLQLVDCRDKASTSLFVKKDA